MRASSLWARGKSSGAARICGLSLLALLSMGGSARAGDAAFDDAGLDAGSTTDGGVPLACDGALCETTNGAGCSSAGGPLSLALMVVTLAALALGRRRVARGPTGLERSP